MNEQTLRFRIGLFVFLSLVLFAVLLTVFGGMPIAFKKAETFVVLFDEAQGVTPGTPVRKAGVRIGEVKSIRLNEETGKVEIEVALDEGYKLRQSDRPTMMRSILGGDPTIALLPANKGEKDFGDHTPVPPGSVLPGKSQADASVLVQKTTDLMPSAQETLADIRRVFARLDRETITAMNGTFERFSKLAPSLDDALQEFRNTAQEIRGLAKSARDTVPELQKTSEEIRALAKTARDKIPDIKTTAMEFEVTARTWGKVGETAQMFLAQNEPKLSRTVGAAEEVLRRLADLFGPENQKNFSESFKNFRAGTERLDNLVRGSEEMVKEGRVTLKQISASLQKADELVANLTQITGPLAQRSAAIVRNLEEGTDRLNKILCDVRELVQAVGRSDGTMIKLIADPSLYNNLNEMALTVTRMLPRVDHIMRDVEIFADKIARHPEALGIGGVVRPSTGLKEAPSFVVPR